MTQEGSQTISQEMMTFIQNHPTSFHVVAGMGEILEAAGYTRLLESTQWSLKAGGKYYVTRNGSALMAFQIPRTDYNGFMIMASHSDAPTFKLKENPEIKTAGAYTTLNVELYGGAILSPWFDRPLSIAGRLLVRDGETIRTQLVKIDRDLVLIPNLAIHMNREVNAGYKYNVQRDLLPLYGGGDARSIQRVMAEAAGVSPEAIIGSDLYLYNRTAPSIWGEGEEFMSSPRLDDTQCAYSSLRGFLESTPTNSVAVHAVFDNEEVGSSTKQGAASTFLKDTLMRINAGLGRSETDYLCSLAQSFMLSADNGHALHPNYADKTDPVNQPVLGGGAIIKYSANQKYTTDGVSAALCKTLCEGGNIPHQVFVNRSDILGGSTLGNLSGNQVAINTVDVGLAQLAMHSPYETGAVSDTACMVALARQLFDSSLVETGAGEYTFV